MANRKGQTDAQMSLEAELYREVCQHLELGESVDRVLSIIANRVPLDALLIRRIEREPTRLSTIAVAAFDSASYVREWGVRTELGSASARAVVRFIRGGRPMSMSGGTDPLQVAILPREFGGTALVLPLLVKKKAVGLGVLVLKSKAALTNSQLELLIPAIGPLCVAFENDQRLHELARMSEALEADRRALLSRLERQDVSEVIIGDSGGLSRVMERLLQVSPTDAPVLILGETGSGKEVIARAIHARSRRAQGPVVRVNCGAIPAELIDSELFGHEKGSFTGATTTRKGWFERADGGTLFLDEIGELPMAAQVRLLRVLQDGTLQRVGGHQTINVDVRVVAATHRHLEAMVAEGKFREDLWYRLSVFPIRLPALRERLEDLRLLAEHFADRAGRRLGGNGLVPSAADIELLQTYAWPGNVRELAAVIERAAILGNGKRLELRAALGTNSMRISVPPPAGEPPVEAGVEESGKLETLDEAMAKHMRRALQVCHGRIEGPFGVAKALGINPHTLRARMRKLGIEWSSFRDSNENANSDSAT